MGVPIVSTVLLWLDNLTFAYLICLWDICERLRNFAYTFARGRIHTAVQKFVASTHSHQQRLFPGSTTSATWAYQTGFRRLSWHQHLGASFSLRSWIGIWERVKKLGSKFLQLRLEDLADTQFQVPNM
jgi:hypothetical protein